MNGSIIMTAYSEFLSSKPLAILDIALATLLLEQLQQRLVLGLAGNDNHIVEVLGSGTDKADATYINLLDNISLASTTATVCSKG